MRFTKQLLALLLLHVGLMVIIFSSFILLFFGWVLPAMTKHGQSITVPDLKGIHAHELPEFLTQRNLQFKITQDMAYSPAYPPAVVLEQYPKPGARVKEGRMIYLTLNATQPPEVSMPNLVDSSVKNAQILLKNKGLVLGKIQYVPDIAQNAVLAQNYQGQPIEPGTRIAQGACIDLVVGAGVSKQLFAMPSLLGMPLQEAELLLLDTGIRLGHVFYQPVDSLEAGTVFQQLPTPGVRIRLGETVDLWLVEAAQAQPSPKPNTPILE